MGRILYIAKPKVPSIKYGLLYNLYACLGTGNSSITSSNDWVVPTESQYNTLITYVGATKAYDLMEDGYWNRSDETNLYDFNMRANGFRDNSGVSRYINGSSLIQSFNWCIDSPTKKYLVLANSSNNITVATSSYSTYGMGVRLLYTGAGTPTEYTGNDGKVYRIVTIDTQIWLADNLAETKYRNGDAITEVTDNSTWAGLTASALCAYSNDWNNV